MTNKIYNFVFFIILFLLQSCSGGKLGNFLESSFKNINSNKISQNDVNKKLKKDIIPKDKKLLEQKDNTKKININGESNSQNIGNSIIIKTNDANKIKKKNLKFKPRSYRVYVILNKVDPSFPTENFSKVLRNGDINFEIEKIELIPELNQNRK